MKFRVLWSLKHLHWSECLTDSGVKFTILVLKLLQAVFVMW